MLFLSATSQIGRPDERRNNIADTTYFEFSDDREVHHHATPLSPTITNAAAVNSSGDLSSHPRPGTAKKSTPPIAQICQTLA
jgi:hypothetical protein